VRPGEQAVEEFANLVLRIEPEHADGEAQHHTLRAGLELEAMHHARRHCHEPATFVARTRGIEAHVGNPAVHEQYLEEMRVAVRRYQPAIALAARRDAFDVREFRFVRERTFTVQRKLRNGVGGFAGGG